MKLSSTYWALVPDGRLIVTVLPVDGLKVYPAEPTIWLYDDPLVPSRTDSARFEWTRPRTAAGPA